jgi:haloalkane dehalogenase
MDHVSFRRRQQRLRLEGVAHIPVDVAYTDIGHGDPLVLLHGIPTWSYLYHDVIDRLASAHRVIAPDFLGHGWSDRRDRFDRSLTAQRAMVLAMLNALDLKQVDLIGHDTGGGVALMMAIENPERIGRLVLSNIVAYDSWPIDDMIGLGHPAWRHRSIDELCAFLLAGYREGLSRPDRLTPEFYEGMLAPYSDEEGKLSLIRNAAALNTNHTIMLQDRHSLIGAPTLLAWGADDPWQRIEDAERLLSEIPDARLVRIEQASHWVPQDAPEEWSRAVLEFLAPELVAAQQGELA